MTRPLSRWVTLATAWRGRIARPWRRGMVAVGGLALGLGGLVLAAPPVSAATTYSATTLSAPIVGMAATASGDGYWLVGSDGGVYAFGGATFYGSMAGTPLVKPIVGMAPDPAAGGYWLVASDGGVFSFGAASFDGSMGGMPLSAPIVGIAATANGDGYWLVGADGGVYAFGAASSYGSTAGQSLNAPIVGMAPDPATGGYWLVGSDGGVFAFNAPLDGSMAGQPLNAPIVGMAATASGDGYWLVGADGGVYAFGGASFYGSTARQSLNAPIVGMAPDPATGGYWLVGSDGSVYAFNVNDTDLALTNVPSNITTDATSPSGAAVAYTAPTPVDEDGLASAAIRESCSNASGSTFPIGTTTVTCAVSDLDDSNSPVTASFTVTVKDTDLAVANVPSNITTDATSPSGAAVAYTAPSAVDEDGLKSAAIRESCSNASGSTFPIGTTTVTCTASDSDDSNSPATASFTVTVRGAASQLSDLYLAVQGVGPGTSLADKVLEAQLYLAQGNVADTCTTLSAFINEVQAHPSITSANELIADASRIEAVLGCSS